uniref:Uncharacterized protein n=1 Tax=Lactuca sativa TaxID=4236 RepID=A0A9R1VL63_LACSA|nr:hypothetical protein LSAT_V11C500287590 [Lactuca sativa]
MHHLLQRHLNETSTPAATVTSPLVTPTYTPTTSTSPLFGIVSTPLSNPSMTLATSSTPVSTPQSSSPTSTTIPSTPVSSEQQDIQLEGHIHVKVCENTKVNILTDFHFCV